MFENEDCTWKHYVTFCDKLEYSMTEKKLKKNIKELLRNLKTFITFYNKIFYGADV